MYTNYMRYNYLYDAIIFTPVITRKDGFIIPPI